MSYKKRSEFLHVKKKRKENAIYKSAFITEDLTPLRTKLLRYVEEECEDNFVLCHIINGAIRVKKLAYEMVFSSTKMEMTKEQATGSTSNHRMTCFDMTKMHTFLN